MIKFLYVNKFDSAVCTSINAASSHAATNVQDRFLKNTWRSTGVSNQWLKFDQGSASVIDMLTIFYNNFTTAATINVYGHTSDLGNTEAAWASAAYVGNLTSFDTRAGMILPGVSYRWWLISITDALNPNAYVELGRVYAGAVHSPDENFSEDISETFIDPSLQNWTVGQTLYSVSRERYKEFNFNFTDLSAANQTIIRNVWAAVYKTEPFVIAFDNSGQPVEFTRYGVLTSDLHFQYTPNARANCGMTFRELR